MNTKRLVDGFVELVKIGSESKQEGPLQNDLKRRLESLGLAVIEDNTAAETKLGAGNLFAVLPGTLDADPIFFSCHSDTVTPGNDIKPQIKNNIIYSDGTTILGADDKAGIAAILEAIAMLKESGVPHRTIELIFTAGEEIGLIGASAFDTSQLSAKYGYVLDGSGPVGLITIASPTVRRLEFNITGKSAHAGFEPEKGISAIEIAAAAIADMDLGRISKETTANIGTITGGTAVNIVADSASFTAEARSIIKKSVDDQIEHMISTTEYFAKHFGGKVSYTEQTPSPGYHFDDENFAVQLVSNAISSIGRSPVTEFSGGASDANIFNAAGIDTVNLSVGYENVHTVNEYIPIFELEIATELIYYLVTHQY